MNKFLLTIVILSAPGYLFAQGVGINTITPDPSAALDIQSSSKGLLIPRISLQSKQDGTTVPNPAKGLMIYNTAGGFGYSPGYYYNAGTAAAPVWTRFDDLKLPYYGVSTIAAPTLNIENLKGNSYAATAIKAYGSGLGTGIDTKSDNGYALRVDGSIKITGNDQVPALGKVLTSDAIGKATWQELPITQTPLVAFSAKGIKAGSGNSQIPPFTDTKLAFLTEKYDIGNNYNDVNTAPHNTFNAPVHGIYHFDVMISWNSGVPDPEPLHRTGLSLNLIRNGNITKLALTDHADIRPKSLDLSIDVELLPGDQVFASFDQGAAGQTFTLLQTESQNYFNGRLQIKL